MLQLNQGAVVFDLIHRVGLHLIMYKKKTAFIYFIFVCSISQIDFNLKDLFLNRLQKNKINCVEIF